VHTVHKEFYGLSCDYDRLIERLNAEKKFKEESDKNKKKEYEKEMKAIKPWEALEDLALKGAKDTLAYQFIVKTREPEDIEERKRFLEI
jgi:hypothetical protein